MSLLVPFFLLCPSFVAAQNYLSYNADRSNVCGEKLAASANATGHSSEKIPGAYSYNNGLGQWRVAVSTNSSTATIEDGRELTWHSPGAIANIWLDPFTDINLNNGENSFSACAYIFKGLPENTIRRGQDDDTSCTTMLSKKCVDAITSRAAETAKWLVLNPTYGPFSNLTPPILNPICQQIPIGIGYHGSTSNPFPAECNPFFADPSQGEEDSYPTIDVRILTGNETKPRNCTFDRGYDNAHNLMVGSYNNPAGTMYPYNATSKSAVASYDELVQQVWPILTVTFPPANNSRQSMVGQAEGTMTCIRAGKIKEGSRVPAALPKAHSVHLPGQLSTGAKAGIAVGVILGVALIAGAAWWLWRRSRRQKQAKKQPPMEDKDATTIVSDHHKDGKEIYQMDTKEAPGQLHGDERVEMGDAAPQAELATDRVPPQELMGSIPASKR